MSGTLVRVLDTATHCVAMYKWEKLHPAPLRLLCPRSRLSVEIWECLLYAQSRNLSNYDVLLHSERLI